MNCCKLFGALLILICCTMFGFYLSYKLKLRLRLYDEIIQLLTAMETNIRYFSDNIYKLIRICAPVNLKCFFNEEAKPFGAFWENAVKAISKSYGITSDDNNTLLEFGRLLGITDVEGQQSHICLYKEIFRAKRDDFENDCKIKTRLCKTLGFFAGATLALLII